MQGSGREGDVYMVLHADESRVNRCQLDASLLR